MDPSSHRLQFGPFEIHVATGELNKDGVPVKLAPQPARVLALLARRAGELVTREEIQAEVWNDGTTVEFDQGLNYCVRQIRLALDDDAKEPQFIETVPKRGYRLLVPVIPVVEEAQSVHPVSARMWPRVAMGVALAVMVALGWWNFKSSLRIGGVPKDPVLAKLYVEAVRMADNWREPEVKKAVEDFREVIRSEADFAPAYAELANALVILPFMGGSAGEALPEAEVMAAKAIALDGSLAHAHAALAHCLWQRWRWAEAGAEFERALALEADSAIAHQLYGLYLASTGRSDAAVEHARRAVELAPSVAVIQHSLAQVYLQTGHFAEAAAQARQTLALDADFEPAKHAQFRASAMQGKLKEAGESLDKWGADKVAVPWRVYWLARSGNLREARTLWHTGMAPGGTGNGTSVAAAVALASMGDVDGAFESLAKSIDKHAGSVIWLNATPELQTYRADARYAVLLSRIGLRQ